MNVQLGPMDDPAERWDSPLSARHTSTDPPIPAFFGALTKADDDVAELAALRAAVNNTTVVPEWKLMAPGIAQLVERYQADAVDCTQREAITNLAGLLRHASAFAGALCRDITHYAEEANEARELAHQAQDRVVELSVRNEELLAAGAWTVHVESQKAMKRERDGECICNTGPDTDGPDEFCPWHGRPYQEIAELLTTQQAEIERLRGGTR